MGSKVGTVFNFGGNSRIEIKVCPQTAKTEKLTPLTMLLPRGVSGLGKMDG